MTTIRPRCYSEALRWWWDKGYQPPIKSFRQKLPSTSRSRGQRSSYNPFRKTDLSINTPDVSTKYIGDGRADKVCLASDGGLVSGADLLPLVLTAFFVLISSVFLHPRLGLWPVGRGSFWSSHEKKKQILNDLRGNSPSPLRPQIFLEVLIWIIFEVCIFETFFLLLLLLINSGWFESF